MQRLPEIVPNRILLVIAPDAAWAGVVEMVASLACLGPLRVLDGGNQFNAYPIARTIRRRTTDLGAVLARIRLARVFTCYQMETLLLNAPPVPEPTLVLDFLATFYDENVSLPERRRLLSGCAVQLRRLSARAPVMVSARPVQGAERSSLLDVLRGAADEVLEWQPPAAALPQPGLL